MDTQPPLSDCPPATGSREREPLDVAAVTRGMVTDDETAYRIFYDAYFDRLWRYLIVVAAGNEDAAREALQATLTRVVRHIKVFSSEPVLWSWLTVLARPRPAGSARTAFIGIGTSESRKHGFAVSGHGRDGALAPSPPAQ